MASFCNGIIECYAGPQELGAPDDLENIIVGFIDDANKYLDIAVQEIDSEPIAQAILNACWRGVTVRIIMEQDYLLREDLYKVKKKDGETDAEARLRTQWEEYRRPKTKKTNLDIFSALLRNTADTKADYNPNIFHQKFIIRDYRGSKLTRSAVLAGSTNFTHTGTHKNFNNVVIFNDHRACKIYRGEFLEIRKGSFGGPKKEIGDYPKVFNVDNSVPVRILFAPDHAPEFEIVKQMNRCQKEIHFAIFTFAESSGIDDAMKILRAAGKKIYGVMDPGQGKKWWAATKWLHQVGIKVYFPDNAQIPGFGKLHHKMMVIDDSIVVGGSMNFTGPANEKNDENIFVIGSPYDDLPDSKGGPVDLQVCADIAGFFKKEIKREIAKSVEFNG